MNIFEYVYQRFQPKKSYLESQRDRVGEWVALGVDPFQQYLPTIMGEISAGNLSRDVLNVGELHWILDELQRQIGTMTFGYTDKDIAAKRAELAAYLRTLEDKGGEWEPTPVTQYVPPLPPHDPSRGR